MQNEIVLKLLAAGLTNLATHTLILIANALAFIGLGLTERAHVGRNLADHLLVNSGYPNRLLTFNDELDSFGRVNRYGVTVAQEEIERPTLEGSTITYTFDNQRTQVTFGNTHHHIVDQRTGKPVKCTILARFCRTGKYDLTFTDLDPNLGLKRLFQRSLGSCDCQRVAL